MISRSSKSHRKPSWRLLVGLLCLALVVVGGTAQVAHSHNGGDLAHNDCSLCATAHVVAQVVSNSAPLVATPVVAQVSEFAPQFAGAPVSIFALFTRPPPFVSKLA